MGCTDAWLSGNDDLLLKFAFSVVDLLIEDYFRLTSRLRGLVQNLKKYKQRYVSKIHVQSIRLYPEEISTNI